MIRTTCLYCENEGVETQLIPYLHWGLCPIHSPEFLKSVAPERDPLLRDVGVPGWAGRSI